MELATFKRVQNALREGISLSLASGPVPKVVLVKVVPVVVVVPAVVVVVPAVVVVVVLPAVSVNER